MEFTTKIAIVVADDLATWQRLNVVAFLTSGVIANTDSIIEEAYMDASGQPYHPLCIQPMVVLRQAEKSCALF